MVWLYWWEWVAAMVARMKRTVQGDPDWLFLGVIVVAVALALISEHCR